MKWYIYIYIYILYRWYDMIYIYIYIWKVGKIIILQVAKPTFMLMVGHWQILFWNYLVPCLEVRIEFQF